MSTQPPMIPNKPIPKSDAALIHLLESQGDYDSANRIRAAFAEAEGLPLATSTQLERFITLNHDMIELKKHVGLLSKVQDTVLIIGETGTGKELIANALHGNRAPNTFISINCAGMPEHLIESELFGHAKGSFTGADRDKQGLFAAAANGTLFLDEIGDLPLGVQAKLLRAMQEMKVRPVGSNVEQDISCRFVAATHHNLTQQVKDKLFRKDLYYRLCTFELHTIPLRDRPEDIKPIIESLDPFNKFPYDRVDVKALRLDGNVRTLQAIVRRFLVLGILPNTNS